MAKACGNARYLMCIENSWRPVPVFIFRQTLRAKTGPIKCAGCVFWEPLKHRVDMALLAPRSELGASKHFQ